MAKKSKMNKGTKAGLTVGGALVSIIPVISAIVLIAVVGLVIILVNNINDKQPTFEGSDEVYFEVENKFSITKNDLYTNMKIEYGAADLMRLIDEKLYAKEIEEAKNNAETDKLLVEYVIENLFGLEVDADKKAKLEEEGKEWKDLIVDTLQENEEDNQKTWDDLIESLKMNNLLKASDVDDEKVTSIESKVWNKVKDYYRLQFVRKEWAKDAYIEAYKAKKDVENQQNSVEAGTYFTEDEIKAKYEALYEGKVYALFIPFTSEEAAKAMMDKYGINTQSFTSINQNGWIKKSYDYNSNANKSEHKMSNQEVLNAFYAMYNEVLAYYNNGQPIIDVTKDLDTNINHSAAFNQAVKNLEDKLDNFVVYGQVTLPTTIKVENGIDVTVAWELKANEYATMENNVVTLNEAENGSKGTIELVATIELTVTEAEKYTKTLDIKLDTKVDKESSAETVNVETVVAEAKYILSQEFMNGFESDKEANQFSKFVWTASELSAIDAKLASNLKLGGSLKPIVGNTEHADFYKSYTVAPIKGTTYTYLMLKFSEEEAKALENVKAEIIEKLFEDLLTDNNITEMIYQNRVDAGVQIYDKYIEAVYDYEYTTFFESTHKGKALNYKAFKESKKNKDSIVAAFTVDGAQQTITAEELYTSLEAKYGVSITIDFFNQFLSVGNDEFNSVYNPFTGVVSNEKVLEELFNSEVSAFRKNFEMDYFTYSYLSYYGFIPNFPASYGWNDFRHDYFGANTDKDLLVSANFGGYLYSEAVEALTEKVYLEHHNKDVTEKYETYEELILDLVKKEIAKLEEKHYSLNVLNVIVSLDTNYDGSYDHNYVNQKGDEREDDDVWTDELEDLAVELAKLIYAKAPETLKDTLSNQLTQVVLEYNQAGLDDETWGAYKKAGLVVKFETSQTYTNTSSLVEEFLDELQKLWDAIPEDLRGETLDAPLLSEVPFESTYGYHHIAITGSTKLEKLPEEDAQLKLYQAVLAYNDVKDSTYTFVEAEKEEAKAALEALLKEYGYDLELSKKENLSEEEKEQLAESKAEFKEKYGFDVDTLSFDDATKKLLGTFYDTPLSNIEAGNELTEYTVQQLETLKASFKFTSENEARLEQLQAIIDATNKDLAEDAEEGEGE